jgi:Raf kinase inhibitor-like YbhB/YbcL family protein
VAGAAYGESMRPTLALVAAAALAAGCGGNGGDRLSGDDLPRAPAALRVSSSAFIDGSRLPQRYTCDGAGEEPPVQAGTVPPSTSELILIVSDPDAPGGTYVHVTRYGISPRDDGSVDRGGQEGLNSAGDAGWTAPCPPGGDAAHRYVWSVYALRDASRLEAGAKPGEVVAELRDGVLASGTITARYGR